MKNICPIIEAFEKIKFDMNIHYAIKESQELAKNPENWISAKEMKLKTKNFMKEIGVPDYETIL